MIKLRTVLLCDKIYYLLLLVVLTISIISISLPRKSVYNGHEKKIIGVITSIYIDGNSLTMNVKAREKLICKYYFRRKLDIGNFSKKYHIGDKISLEGNLEKPSSQNTEYLFNYRNYLYNKKIFYIFKIDNYKKVSNNRFIYYKIKQLILKRIDKNPYLQAFILGDKRYIKSDVLESFQFNGISHLLAISGMHVNLLGAILLKIFLMLGVREEKRYLFVSIILMFYAILTGLSASVLRGVLFFILFSINKIFYFYIKNTNIFIITVSIALLINPFFLYDVSFWYSFSISLSLLVMGDVINKYNGYFIKLLMTSIISFVVSIPISIYNFYQINFLSIIYNLFYVPFVSIIIFPASLITFIIKPIEPIYNIFTNILETTSVFLVRIDFLTLIFKRVYFIIYIIYFVFIILLFIGIRVNNKRYFVPIILLLIIHYFCPYFDIGSYIKIIDVGQGDSILIHSKNSNILIDTGGITSYNMKQWQKRKNQYSVVKNTTIPLLKSMGIKRINYLILTHGDYDHMGEAINLVNNFKVEKVIFNCGPYNDLEKELIKVLNKKHIKYYSCIKELNIDKNKLYFLQTKEYDNENDNSNVIYTELNGYKFMFMGDASINTEKEILNKYNLPDIDVLKVGHHGSRTSSFKEFINEINPKYSVISVGKDNRFGHPNKEVLENLNKSKIYRTDQDGSIMFKIKNNKLKIETVSIEK